MDEIINKTICWTCANATGNCPWSAHDSPRPVPGWIAEKTVVKAGRDITFDSFIVYNCPMYIRDSLNNGLERLQERKAV